MLETVLTSHRVFGVLSMYVMCEYKYGYATVVLVNAVSDAQSEVQELIINNRSINQSALIQSYSVRSYRG